MRQEPTRHAERSKNLKAMIRKITTILNFLKSLSMPVLPPIELYENIVNSLVTSELLKNELTIKIKRAYEDPQSFYDTSGKYILSERGLVYSKKDSTTPKFVLIDTLIDNDQMIEVDWKEAEEDIRYGLNKIIESKGYNFQLSEDNLYDEDEETFEIIYSISDEELQPLGYSIEMIDINSDSYVLTVVPLNIHKQVKNLFEKIK